MNTNTNTHAEPIQSTAHARGYLPEDPGAYLYPDTPNARRELEDLAPYAARFVHAFEVRENSTPAPGEDGTAEYLEAREVLAQSRLRFLEHAERVGPRALRALERFTRERPSPGALRARAEDALRKELDEDAGRVDLEPGSAYRVTSNPNPDGLDVDDVDTHGTGPGPYGDRLPALNVKAYPDLRRVDFDDVRADLGLETRTQAPTGRFVNEYGETVPEDEEGAEPEVLPFGLDWILGRYDVDDAPRVGGSRESELWEGPEQWARESAWEDAQESARELFGDLPGVGDVKVWSAGRCGGWACVQGLPDLEDLQERADYPSTDEFRALDLDDEDEADEAQAYEQEAEEARAELDRILGAWSEFAHRGAATVEDLGRAIAWNVGSNVFEHEAREYLEDLQRTAEEDAERAELERFALLGRRVVQEFRERSMMRTPKRDEDGERERTVLGDGLARDGFHALHDYAEELGFLEPRD
jgi:hypothetical protein